MWSVFYMIYEAFQKDAFDYFAGKVTSKGLLMIRIGLFFAHKTNCSRGGGCLSSLLTRLNTCAGCCVTSMPSLVMVLLLVSCLVEMMPCLHNYITVDTPAFLANPKNMEVIYNICKKVWFNFLFVIMRLD